MAAPGVALLRTSEDWGCGSVSATLYPFSGADEPALLRPSEEREVRSLSLEEIVGAEGSLLVSLRVVLVSAPPPEEDEEKGSLSATSLATLGGAGFESLLMLALEKKVS